MASDGREAAHAEWVVEMSGYKEEIQLYSLSRVTWASKASACAMWKEFIMFYDIYGATTSVFGITHSEAVSA